MLLLSAFPSLTVPSSQLMACLASVCTKTTCPEMESDGQRFLCAAHTPPLEVFLLLLFFSLDLSDRFCAVLRC